VGEHSSNIKIANPGQLNNAMYAMRPQLKQQIHNNATTTTSYNNNLKYASMAST
jgi:hypothetical protein